MKASDLVISNFFEHVLAVYADQLWKIDFKIVAIENLSLINAEILGDISKILTYDFVDFHQKIIFLIRISFLIIFFIIVRIFDKLSSTDYSPVDFNLYTIRACATKGFIFFFGNFSHFSCCSRLGNLWKFAAINETEARNATIV